MVLTGVQILMFPQGPGAATPNLTQFFNVFRLIVSRSTVAKRDKVDITFMARFVGRGILNITCVTDQG